MKHTESHYGLIISEDNMRVSCDNGDTWQDLPLSQAGIEKMLEDAECWWCRNATEDEIEDLKELLG